MYLKLTEEYSTYKLSSCVSKVTISTRCLPDTIWAMMMHKMSAQVIQKDW